MAFSLKTIAYALILLSIGGIGYLNLQKLGNFIHDKTTSFSPADSTHFKLLVLPFSPLVGSENSIENFQDLLVSDLNKLDTSMLNVKYLMSIDAPKSNAEALEILENKYADMVIWGIYHEKQTGKNSSKYSIRLNYLIREDAIKDEEMKINEKLMDTADLIDAENIFSIFEKGVIEGDIGQIINWILGIKAFENFKYVEATTFFEKALKHNNSLLNKDKLLPIAYIYEILERHQKSIDFVTESIEKNPLNQEQLYHAYSILGRSYSDLDSLDSGMDYFRKCLDLVDSKSFVFEDKKDAFLSSTYTSMGLIKTKKNQLDSALIYLKKSLEYKIDDETLISDYTNLAQLYMKMNLLDSVNFYHKKSLKVAEASDVSPQKIINLHYSIGNFHFEVGEYFKAKEQWLKCKTLAEKFSGKNHTDYLYTLNALSVAYNNLEQRDSSNLYLDEVMLVAEEQKNPMLSTLYLNKGSEEYDSENYQKAIK